MSKAYDCRYSAIRTAKELFLAGFRGFFLEVLALSDVSKHELLAKEIEHFQKIIKKPVVLAGLSGALIVILIIAVVAGRPNGPSDNKKKIRAQAVPDSAIRPQAENYLKFLS